MKFWERITAMFGYNPTLPDHDGRVILDQTEGRMAGRLSKLTGKRRDEVLAEAYRRAETLRVEADSIRRR